MHRPRTAYTWPIPLHGANLIPDPALFHLAEYEFYQFRAPSNSQGPVTERNSSATASFLNENPVHTLPSLTEGMFGYSITRPVHNQDYYYGIFDACEKFRCNIEGWHTESGPGVYEAV